MTSLAARSVLVLVVAVLVMVAAQMLVSSIGGLLAHTVAALDAVPR